MQELEDSTTRETMRRNGFSEIEIEKTIQEGRTAMPAKPLPEEMGTEPTPLQKNKPKKNMGLTDDDIAYLTMKWGAAYEPEQ